MKQIFGVDLASEDLAQKPINIALIPGGMAGGVIARAIAGYQQSGASSSKFDQGFFGDLTVNIPIGSLRHPKSECVTDEDLGCNAKVRQLIQTRSALGPTFRIFGSFRLTTTPRTIDSSVGEFFTDLSGQLAKVKLNELVASTEVLMGVEQRFWATGHSYGNFLGSYRQRDP